MAIIGAGTIGPDIGYYIKSALPGIKLYLVDVVEAALKNAEKRYENYAQKAVEKKKMKEDKAKEVLQNIVYTMDYEQIKNCDLVIEAATENIPLKQRIFESVEGDRPGGRDHHLQHELHPGRPDLQQDEETREDHHHPFLCARLALAARGGDPVGEDRAQKSMDYLFWFFAQTGKVPIITDNVALLHAGPGLRQLVATTRRISWPMRSQARSTRWPRSSWAAGLSTCSTWQTGTPSRTRPISFRWKRGSITSPRPFSSRWTGGRSPRPGSKVDVPEDVKKIVRDRLLGILFSQSFDIVDRGIGTKRRPELWLPDRPRFQERPSGPHEGPWGG